MATNIIDLVTHVQKQGEMGRERGQQTALAKLFSQAQTAPRDQRQGLLAQMGGISPQAAFDAQKHFDGMDDNGRSELGRYAAAFDALPDDQKPMAYPQLARQAQALGIPAPMEWKAEYAPNIAKLAQAFGGGGGGSVQSRFVGEDGMVYAMMRDGSLQSTGVKADRQMWLRDHPGMQPELVGKDGSARPVGMAPQAQPGVSLGQPMPFTIGDDIPPQVAAQIRAQEEAAGGTFAGSAPQQAAPQQLPPQLDYTGGGYTPGAPRPAMTPAQAAAEQRAREAAARAARAEDRAVRGTPPTGMRWNAMGTALEPIPGAPAPRASQPSEGERSAAGYLQRMEASEGDLQAIRDAGYRPESSLRDYYTAGEGPLLNWMASDQGQHNRQQQEDWVRAKLRKESGAVIADEEMDREIKTYFPQPGDSATVIEAKAKSRQRALEQMRKMAGRALSSRASADTPDPAPPSANGGGWSIKVKP